MATRKPIATVKYSYGIFNVYKNGVVNHNTMIILIDNEVEGDDASVELSNFLARNFRTSNGEFKVNAIAWLHARKTIPADKLEGRLPEIFHFSTKQAIDFIEGRFQLEY